MEVFSSKMHTFGEFPKGQASASQIDWLSCTSNSHVRQFLVCPIHRLRTHVEHAGMVANIDLDHVLCAKK